MQKKKEIKDFLYYSLRLVYLNGEMEKKSAEGFHTPQILPLYLKEIMKGYLFVKMTAKERKLIKKLLDELQGKYGKENVKDGRYNTKI